MKEIIIDSTAAGQRLDRYLIKRLPHASKGFIQKMIRKKNIKLNGGRGEPSTLLALGDAIQIYFSDETLAKFSQKSGGTPTLVIPPHYLDLFTHPVYEDENLLVINKPAGLLTQPDDSGAAALSHFITQLYNVPGDTFHPAPSNRLDLNTSGIVLVPKNYETQREVNACIRARRVSKTYLALVRGALNAPLTLKDTLVKDSATNCVTVAESSAPGGLHAELKATPLKVCRGYSLVEIALYTGRSHQIRVQLTKAGYPVVGDPKYGNASLNATFKQDFGLRRQLLHAWRYTLPSYSFCAPLPPDFMAILSALGFSSEDL